MPASNLNAMSTALNFSASGNVVTATLATASNVVWGSQILAAANVVGFGKPGFGGGNPDRRRSEN